jgi:anaphase-promoting complex subunit 2
MLCGPLSLQENFSKVYRRLRPDKLLKWFPHLGTAEIELEMNDGRVIKVSDATSLQASIVELFTMKGQPTTYKCTILLLPPYSTDRWTVMDLLKQLNLNDISPLLNGLYFWANKGVLREVSSQEVTENSEWVLVEKQEDIGETVQARSKDLFALIGFKLMNSPSVVEEEEPQIKSVLSTDLGSMEVFWPQIKSLVSKFGICFISRLNLSDSSQISDQNHWTKFILRWRGCCPTIEEGEGKKLKLC